MLLKAGKFCIITFISAAKTSGNLTVGVFTCDDHGRFADDYSSFSIDFTWGKDEATCDKDQRTDPPKCKLGKSSVKTCT